MRNIRFHRTLPCITVPSMTQAALSSSNSGNTNFASVLAEQTFGKSIARGMPKPPLGETLAGRKLDLLEDDVVAISYEQALRTHARSTSLWSRQSAVPSSNHRPATDEPAAAAPPGHSPLHIHEIAHKAARHERRSASITIRLSRAECEQIHTRAEQAGITVSAYLRSCVLEAEDLRAQVKKMIAEMRAAQEPMATHSESAKLSSRPSRWRQFFVRFFRSRRAVIA